MEDTSPAHTNRNDFPICKSGNSCLVLSQQWTMWILEYKTTHEYFDE